VRPAADERVALVLAGRVGGDREQRVLVGGDVLGGVDGEVNGAVQERSHNPAHERALAPGRVDRPVVALGADDRDLGGDAVPSEA